MDKHKKRSIILIILLVCFLGLLVQVRQVQAEDDIKWYVKPAAITWIHGGSNTYTVRLFTKATGTEKYTPEAKFSSQGKSLIYVKNDEGEGHLKDDGTTKTTGQTSVYTSFYGKTYKCLVKKINPKLNKTKLTLKLGGTTKATLKVSDLKDVNGKNLKCEWNSSDQRVAIVNDGVVYAKKAGSAVISCRIISVQDDNNRSEKTLKCKVTVKKKSVQTETIVSPTANADVVIKTVDQMEKFISQVNEGDQFEGKTIVLVNDLDYSGRGFTPMKEFKGTFDGSGRRLIGVTIRMEGDIGFVQKNDGIIRNLILDKLAVEEQGSGAYIGGIAANNYGTIDGCVVNGTFNVEAVMTNNFFGGIAGRCAFGGQVENCYVNADFLTMGESVTGIGGGIVGETINGGVKNSEYEGAVYGNDIVYGGIIGKMTDRSDYMENCFSMMRNAGSLHVSGLTSVLVGKIENSFFLEREELSNMIGTVDGEYSTSRKVTSAEVADGTVLNELNNFAGQHGEYHSWTMNSGFPRVDTMQVISLILMNKGGKIQCEKIGANKGELITVYAKPKKGYQTAEMVASSLFVGTVGQNQKSNVLQFTMPETAVEVKVTFKKK